MSLAKRVEALEKATGPGDRVIVTEYEGQKRYDGQDITPEAYEALLEKHDILLIEIVREGDEQARDAG